MTIIIEPGAWVSSLADIEDSVRGTRIIVRAGARIDAFVKVKPAGGSGDVVIGPRSYINSGVVIYTGNGVEIGADVLVAANCTFAPVDHEFRTRSKLIRDQGFRPSRGGIRVEDDTWIGAGTVLLDGAHIGTGAVIGALSLVTGVIPAYSLARGRPALFTGSRE
jgi:virginiamycin A acetyltransferase